MVTFGVGGVERVELAVVVMVIGIVIIDVVLQVIPILGALVVIFLLIPLSAVVWLLMMYKAYQGEDYKLPLVGQWAADRI